MLNKQAGAREFASAVLRRKSGKHMACTPGAGRRMTSSSSAIFRASCIVSQVSLARGDKVNKGVFLCCQTRRETRAHPLMQYSLKATGLCIQGWSQPPASAPRIGHPRPLQSLVLGSGLSAGKRPSRMHKQQPGRQPTFQSSSPHREGQAVSKTRGVVAPRPPASPHIHTST